VAHGLEGNGLLDSELPGPITLTTARPRRPA
jgi:hypothetical protein